MDNSVQNNPAPESTPLVSTTPVAPSQTIPQGQYAGFWKRSLAYFIDSLLVGLISLSIGFSFTNLNGGMALFPGVLISAAYFIFFWIKHEGQTLGNKLLAIKVVREDGLPIDFSTGIVRYIGYLISGLVFYLGFLWVIWDKKKQGWHDKIAKTVVVKTEGKSHTKLATAVILLTIFGLFLIIAIFGATMFLLFKKDPTTLKAFEKDIGKSSGGKGVSELTQSEADTVALETFDAVNKYRKGKGLQELKIDSKLCAYAQRRLEDLSILGRYDDGRGFYEDMANQAIINAYFTEYKNNGETYFPLLINGKPVRASSAKDIGDIVKGWAGDGSEKRTINVKTDDSGCARADTKSLILIVGTHR